MIWNVNLTTFNNLYGEFVYYIDGIHTWTDVSEKCRIFPNFYDVMSNFIVSRGSWHNDELHFLIRTELKRNSVF